MAQGIVELLHRLWLRDLVRALLGLTARLHMLLESDRTVLQSSETGMALYRGMLSRHQAPLALAEKQVLCQRWHTDYVLDVQLAPVALVVLGTCHTMCWLHVAGAAACCREVHDPVRVCLLRSHCPPPLRPSPPLLLLLLLPLLLQDQHSTS